MPRKRKPRPLAYPLSQMPHKLNMPMEEIKRLAKMGSIRTIKIGDTTLVTKRELDRILREESGPNTGQE